MQLHPKPVELVESPLDGQVQFEELNAPATGEIYLHQVVKSVSGTATPLAGTETTGFYLAVSDTTPTLPAGSTQDLGQAGWYAARPSKVRVVPLSGKKAIISAKGTLAAANIGAQFGLLQEGPYTVLNLANTTNQAAKILAVVEGQVGDQYARVLVQFN